MSWESDLDNIIEKAVKRQGELKPLVEEAKRLDEQLPKLKEMRKGKKVTKIPSAKRRPARNKKRDIDGALKNLVEVRVASAGDEGISLSDLAAGLDGASPTDVKAALVALRADRIVAAIGTGRAARWVAV